MEFSIVIPVYNAGRYLYECFNSIKNQEYIDFEVIIIDDGSTDESGSICDDLVIEDKRFRVIHKKNEGLISARRRGLKEVSGEYVLFCDSDDLLQKNTLSVLHDIIQTSRADVISFNATVFDENNKKSFSDAIFDEGIVNKLDYINQMFCSYTLNSMCMKAMKRTAIDISRDYKEFYKCNFGEDLLQSVPIILNAKSIYYTSESLYLYRTNSGMMRKYSSNYYWSYKRVNSEILVQLENANISDAKKKVASHLLQSTYGAVIQAQFAIEFPRDDWKAIRKDDSFLNAYKIYKKSKSEIIMNRKEQIVLFAFKHNITFPIYCILKTRNRLKR